MKHAFKTIGKSSKIPPEYFKTYREPPALPCWGCKRWRPGWVEMFGGYHSLIYCKGCAEKSERASDRADRAQAAADERAQLKANYALAGLSPADVALEFKLMGKLAGFARARNARPDDRVPYGGYLWGPSGTGKTTQIALAVRRYTQEGWRCKIITEAALLASLKKGGGADLRDYIGLDLLAVDEIGRDELTPWGRAQLAELIDSRCSARYKRPTLFTSNVSPLDLPKAPGGLSIRTVNRILDACGHEPGASNLPPNVLRLGFDHRNGVEV